MIFRNSKALRAIRLAALELAVKSQTDYNRANNAIDLNQVAARNLREAAVYAEWLATGSDGGRILSCPCGWTTVVDESMVGKYVVVHQDGGGHSLKRAGDRPSPARRGATVTAAQITAALDEQETA